MILKPILQDLIKQSTLQNTEKTIKTPMAEIVKTNGVSCYRDPVRERYICVTPEERVRQNILLDLIHREKVPSTLIRVEEPLKHFGIDTAKRADILVLHYESECSKPTIPLVIECKAKNVSLGHLEVEQVLDYGELLSSRYAILTNGEEEKFYQRLSPEGAFVEVDEIPHYSNMLNDSFIPISVIADGSDDVFCSFDDMKSHLADYYNLKSNYNGVTDYQKALISLNLQSCFMNTDERLLPIKSDSFELVSDLGFSNRKYKNKAQFDYTGLYRSFEISTNGQTETIAIRVWEVIYSYIHVARDNKFKKISHHSLQYNTDKQLDVQGKTCRFFHNGDMATGSPIALKTLAQEAAPHLLGGEKFFLGALKNDRVFTLSDPDITKFVTALIEYALLRDNYQRLRKEQH